MDIATGGLPIAGRRRVTQLSKDEWREALQQQMREKEEHKKAQEAAKRFTMQRPRDDAQSHGTNQTEELAEPCASSTGYHQPIHEDDSLAGTGNNPLMGGRRFVRAMSNDEWRASLEEQIRQKQQQRSQTAPIKKPIGVMNGPERLIATAEESSSVATIPQRGDGAGPSVGGRRRGGQPQQSREEYLRGLQEQIELKKKQQEADEAVAKSRGRHGRRRIIEDDDCEGFWTPQPVPSVKSIPNDSQPTDDVVSEVATPPAADKATEESTDVTEIATEVSPVSDVASVPVVALDPAALSKLLELCEGMKQQNEELKQQLRGQQSVLATLSGKTAKSETPLAKTKTSSNGPKAKAKSNDDKAVKPKTLPGSDPRRSSKADPAKSSKLPGLGTNAEKKRAPVEKIVVKCAESVERTRSCENSKAVASATSPPTTMKSRLQPPRVVPRLRPVLAVVPDKTPLLGTLRDSIAVCPAHDAPEGASAPTATEKKALPSDYQAETLEVEKPGSVSELARLDMSCEVRLPLLVPSPSSHQLKKTSRSRSTSAPLPDIRTPRASLQSASALFGDVCLDDDASTELTSSTLQHPLETCHHADLDLEACSSSVPVLYGSSKMIPCGYNLFSK